MAAITYKDAGVNIEAGDQLVDKISTLVKSTLDRRVKTAIGGYASLFALDNKRYLAASTDGVGTKLKLAFRLNEHRTVGMDLVAMSVNDLVCVGAEPLFFLDYFATSKLDVRTTSHVIEGIVAGCKQASCALVGGETAEMPDFYSAGEYDLAGFAVGIVDRSKVLPVAKIEVGDILIGLASSGFHSNGYSLLRKLLPEGKEGDVRARQLLTPTRIYVKPVMPLIEERWIKGLAHITGSGFLNIPRISQEVSYQIDLPPAGEIPEVFSWVAEQSQLSLEELAKTFNMGVGMVAVVGKKNVDKALDMLKDGGLKAWALGKVTRKSSEGSSVKVKGLGQEAILKY